MNKILRRFAAFAVILAAACFIPALSGLSGGIQASALTSGNYSFIELDDGTLLLESYDGTDKPTSLTLPSSAGGKKVTSIGGSAFTKIQSSLKSVKIPSTVISIQPHAFSDMTALEKVEFAGSGLKYIYNYGFLRCGKLSSITLPNTVEYMGEAVFKSCTSLKSFTVPSKLTEINTSMFSNCTSLSSITIPSTIKTFGAHAFDNTAWLKTKKAAYSSKLVIVNNILIDGLDSPNTSITLNETLEGIAPRAFYDNDTVKSIVIPASCKTIGAEAFAYCDSLEKITIPSNVTDFGGNAFDKTPWVTAQQKKNPCVVVNGVLVNGDACTGAVTVPTTVRKIGEKAFANNHNITSVVVKSGVKSIENEAFYNCSKLTKVTLPATVTAIGCNAFFNCTALSSINLPSGLKSIDDGAFQYCKSLTSVTIPDSVTWIGGSAFHFCTGITKLVLPNSAAQIATAAFAYCTSLTSVTIPAKTVFIGNAQFNGDSALTSVTFKEGFKDISGYSFQGCTSIAGLTFPSTLKSIGEYAFSGCNKVEYLSIPNSVEKIGYYAFAGVTSLISVKIHAGTKTIADGAFAYSKIKPTIICSRNSAAETYAKKNDFPISYFEISTRRFYGNSRYGTASAVAEKTYPNGCKNIVIASGSSYADALAGVPLANALDAPILLSTPNGLDNTTIARIKTLKPTAAYILGGPGAVPMKVQSQLLNLGVKDLHTYYGANRYDTAFTILDSLKDLGKTPDTVFIVSATAFPDALSASAAAAVNNAAILYADAKGAIETSTSKALNSVKSKLKKIYVVGGNAIIPDSTMTALKSYCSSVERISGANRYATNAAVNEKFKTQFDNNRVCVVTGKDFPDALTAGVHAAKTKSALILADQSLVMETKQFLIKKCPMLITAIGGAGAVPNDILDKMVAAVKSGW